MSLTIPEKNGRRWDLVALGEVMLRFDPGEGRVHTARISASGRAAVSTTLPAACKRCFGLDTALVTAFADNPVGRLLQDLIYQGGVDQSHVRWVHIRRRRPRGAQRPELHRARLRRARRGRLLGSRPHRASQQLKPGEATGQRSSSATAPAGCTPGGIFCALSETTPAVAREA